MGKTIKKAFLVTMLFSTILFLAFPFKHIAHANENAKKTEEAKEKAEADAKAAEIEAKEKADNIGEAGDPPSGPNVNRDIVEEEVNIDTPASVTGQKIDGTGTVTDFSTNGSKAFYTITDQEDNVFYLIIDLDKTDNNVYFLSDIKKTDLSEGNKEEVSHVQPPTKIEAAKTEAPKEEESGNGFLIAVLLLAVVGVAAYYFLVMKKRQGQNNEEDDEMSEEYEDDFYDDDEQVNKGNQ